MRAYGVIFAGVFASLITGSIAAPALADGMKNREIGPALYMSVGTVEAHLTRIYRKLGIRSRSELVRMVADGDV